MAAPKSNKSQMPEGAAQAAFRLPFLVGLWMSRADDEAGNRDDLRERQALLQLLERYARDIHIPAICRDAARESLQFAQNSGDWTQFGELKMDQLRDILKQVDHYMKAERAHAYRKMLYHIALGVARAHGEFGLDEGKGGGIGGFFAGLLRRRDDDDFSPENVSAKERAALDALREAMRGG